MQSQCCFITLLEGPDAVVGPWSYEIPRLHQPFALDLERAKYWLGKGAQPSDTVASFIKKASKAAAATAAPAPA